MTVNIVKFKRLKESVISISSIIIFLLIRNLYENGIILEVYLRAFKPELSLVSLKQSQAVRLQQKFCQLKTSVVSYEVPDLSSVDRYVLGTVSLPFSLLTAGLY